MIGGVFIDVVCFNTALPPGGFNASAMFSGPLTLFLNMLGVIGPVGPDVLGLDESVPRTKRKTRFNRRNMENFSVRDDR